MSIVEILLEEFISLNCVNFHCSPIYQPQEITLNVTILINQHKCNDM